MKQISVQAFQKVINAEANNPAVDFINVCTTDEYNVAHIPGVRSVPLDEIATHVPEFNEKKTVYIHCRSGGRSQMAIAQLESIGVTAELVNVDGGIMAWSGAGFPME